MRAAMYSHVCNNCYTNALSSVLKSNLMPPIRSPTPASGLWKISSGCAQRPREPQDEKTGTQDGPKTNTSFSSRIDILRETQNKCSPKETMFEFCGGRRIFEFSVAGQSAQNRLSLTSLCAASCVYLENTRGCILRSSVCTRHLPSPNSRAIGRPPEDGNHVSRPARAVVAPPQPPPQRLR